MIPRLLAWDWFAALFILPEVVARVSRGKQSRRRWYVPALPWVKSKIQSPYHLLYIGTSIFFVKKIYITTRFYSLYSTDIMLSV